MDIRTEFLKFFERKGHKVYDSAPLVPDDPTLLFVNAGMVQFKSVFTGEIPTPNPPRAVSSQTCIRAGGKHNDLENVGYTNRHHTFFEMLGNFSFGDYFKENAIKYAWEFITEILKLPTDKLWVTVHDSDNEAEEIWKKYVKNDRIKRFGDKDNFWQMGDTGPCGPCSEIFYDQGSEKFNSNEDYLGGEGDRFLEIWNLVFMQYERSKDGTLTPLPKPSIDTGMGLERVVAVMEGVPSNYDTELFMPLINQVSNMCKIPYVYDKGASFRVIADHIRSVTFLLAQGITFDKEGRGYVLRRILRRAVRHGYLLGLRKPFMYQLVDTLCNIMGKHYPYIIEKSNTIKEMIKNEEEKFLSTIVSGLELFEKELLNTQDIFSGEVAFKLYDTFGFPLDLTADMLRELGKNVDIAKFEELMDKQKKRSQASWKGSGDKAKDGDFKELLEKFSKNEFTGYDSIYSQSLILSLLDENFKTVDKLNAGEKGWIFLDKTPFYAQSGGQCGDKGVINDKDDNNLSEVIDTQKFFELNLSQVLVKKELKTNQKIQCKVDDSRNEIKKHHSATHILHSALKRILGEHVNQAGSLVLSDKLRFDFSHPKAMSEKEIERVQDFVNKVIFEAIPRITKIMPVDEAKKSGAMALFGEKYGDEVRVVSFDKVSVELCGGTHIKNSSEIGSFYITKESGVSAGVRRIEAVCGKAAYDYSKNYMKNYSLICEEVKNKDPFVGIRRLKEQSKEQKIEIAKLQNSNKKELKVDKIGDVSVIVEEVNAGDIKTFIDEFKNQNDKICVMLFQRKGDKIAIACGIKNAPLKAGTWIKEIAPILGGNGGGRDDFAQAGGKDITKLNEAITKAKEYVKNSLGE